MSGALAGLPPESTRYITREELLAMPQVSFTVTDDTNFTGPTKIRGVKLEDLARDLAHPPRRTWSLRSAMTATARIIRMPTSRRIIPCWCSK